VPAATEASRGPTYAAIGVPERWKGRAAMSTRSGALQVPKVHLPKAQLAIAAVLVAIAIAVTVWAGLGSDSSPTTTSSTPIEQIERPAPGRERAKQLGVDVGTVVPSAGETIIVNGEVCEICWKYK
jgi:hypothetical protein